ncbi:MAG: DUF2723 domain-containing protein [Chitinophagaceae bacterium]|nr:DUF2723 domain-containing protein [Chitinophagaceae bacterium]
MNFNRINNISGWAVFAIATVTYLLTMEPTVSLWDCGEFISTCFKIQVPHPPGAPLFILMGRAFILVFGNNPETAAVAVNSMSAVMSGFTILFLFWSITFFAGRTLSSRAQRGIGGESTLLIISAGATGALAYAFSDSFWFSAVEGEVYASSSFFTALVFWAMLKWERRAGQPGSNKWIVFIFYMIGLSIGVHLLNLLAIPALVMVYYFRKYKPTVKGTIAAFIVGCVITGFVQKFLIQYSVKAASWFDVSFVNSIGLPFFSGFATFFVLLAIVLVFALRYSARTKRYNLNLAIWCTVFLFFGYSTYVTTMIRSNANPGVDMFNVDNPISLEGYLGREQYADWPIVYGPDFTDALQYKNQGNVYVRGEKKYEVAGKIKKPDWASAPSAHFFPRMWDNDNDRQQQACYRRFGGLEEGEAPTMANNMQYFLNYQAGWMYMRYFMWNFAGRQNDFQGLGNARDSNWISGVQFIDNAIHGNQSQMPDTASSDNKAHNRLFMLPLIVGIAGLIIQYKRKKRDFLVNFLLFFFTGLAVVVYLNQSGFQPRERDYAYVGSFYAFAIWIGLGVIAVDQLFKRFIRNRYVTYAAIALTFLAVPLRMLQEEWDDHDRSQKTLALDMARNYLESCPKNAMLFTFEDNDTYPLWYAQEVEGIRPDVRVIVNTLSGSDWFMNQLRYKVNESAPFDVIFTKQQVQGDNRQVMYFVDMPGYDKNEFYDLKSTFKNILASDDPKFTTEGSDGELYNIVPVKKFKIPVNREHVIKTGAALPGDEIVDELKLDLSAKNYLLRGDLVMLAIVATTDWNRPVCFTSASSLRELGLDKYVRQEGMTYRLVPVLNKEDNPNVNTELAFNNMMQKFQYGSTNKKGIYYDEENRRRLNYMRLAHAQVAVSLANSGQEEKAIQLLRHFDKQYNSSDYPYGMTCNRGNQHNAISLQYLLACYLAGDKALAKKVDDSVRKDLRQQLRYYNSLGDHESAEDNLASNALAFLRNQNYDLGDKQIEFANDILSSYQLLHQLDEWKNEYKLN